MSTPKTLPGLERLAQEHGWTTEVVQRSGHKNDRPVELTVLRCGKSERQLAACWHDGGWNGFVSKDLTQSGNQTEFKAALQGPPSSPQEGVEDDPRENIRWEREYLEAYISGHPLDYLKASDLKGSRPSTDLQGADDGEWFVMVGVVADVVKKPTRTGGTFARFSVEDAQGVVNAIAFGKIAEGAGGGIVARLGGRVSIRDESPELKVLDAEIIQEW